MTTKHKRGRNLVRNAFVGVAAVALLAVGCSSAEEKTGGAGDGLNLVEPGVLTLMTSQDARPTSFVEDGKVQGLAVDMWEYLGKEMGLKVEYKVLATDTGMSAIAAGQLDSAATGLVASPERKKNLDFSTPWIYGYYGVLVRNDSNVGKLDDLKGRSVAVTKGSDPARLLTEKYPDAQQREYADSTSQIVAVKSGQVDATLLGNNGITAAIQQYPDLKVVDQVPLPYPNGFPVKKGNSALLAKIDAGIKKMMDDGTFVSIYKKWHPNAPFPERLFEDYPALKGQVTS